MKPKFCLPIRTQKLSEIPSLIRAHLTDYDYFEFWLDYLESYDLEQLEKILESYLASGVFLFRRDRLEAPRMAPGLRMESIKMLGERGALIDLDIETQLEELQFVETLASKPRLLLSYHNYSSTPNETDLLQKLEAMSRYSPEISKISCFCNSPADAERLMNLMIQMKDSGRKFVLLGMGSYGAITRVAGALWGNEMNFAPVTSAGASAPGQLLLKDLKQIIELMG